MDDGPMFPELPKAYLVVNAALVHPKWYRTLAPNCWAKNDAKSADKSAANAAHYARQRAAKVAEKYGR